MTTREVAILCALVPVLSCGGGSSETGPSAVSAVGPQNVVRLTVAFHGPTDDQSGLTYAATVNAYPGARLQIHWFRLTFSDGTVATFDVPDDGPRVEGDRPVTVNLTVRCPGACPSIVLEKAEVNFTNEHGITQTVAEL